MVHDYLVAVVEDVMRLPGAALSYVLLVVLAAGLTVTAYLSLLREEHVEVARAIAERRSVGLHVSALELLLAGELPALAGASGDERRCPGCVPVDSFLRETLALAGEVPVPKSWSYPWGLFGIRAVATPFGYDSLRTSLLTVERGLGTPAVLRLNGVREDVEVIGASTVAGAVDGLRFGPYLPRDLRLPGKPTLRLRQLRNPAPWPSPSWDLDAPAHTETWPDRGGVVRRVSFTDPALSIRGERVAIGRGDTLIGRVIVSARASITVARGAHLEHVILSAPEIRFVAGARVSCQALATHSVTLESGARLEYPSTVALAPDIAYDTARVRLRSGSQLEGWVSVTNASRGTSVVSVDEGAAVRGTVIAGDFLDLRGTIEGSAVVRDLLAELPGSRRVGLLYGGTLVERGWTPSPPSGRRPPVRPNPSPISCRGVNKLIQVVTHVP